MVETESLAARAAWAVRAWWLIAAMWARSMLAYRASFALSLAANVLITFLDFAVLVLMFRHTPQLAGWRLPEAAFLYGTSSAALGAANVLVGSVSALGERVRSGTLDTMLVRPAPALAQLAAERFSLRRIGRLVQALAVLGWSITALDVRWTWGKALMVPGLLLTGTVIFCAIFVACSCVQFWWGDAAELQNSVTYGGATLLQYPPTVFAKEVVAGTVFGVPLAFVNWLPALYVLDRPDPLGLPGGFRFASPLAAALCVLAAALAWRAGLRAYRSTGN
ncbi:ABC transporter permease [Streptomyces sp. TLI_171]|uniref:ABC transporter permease n=1 Tax=Streptomyces sp. TLI_171 TaxID=1938859 RepID=UPI000C64DD52|nr:ABC-2 family transporter protein [Streptomyces sp. TLI_171]RKE19225.1 ABC-2 type transport system permease protein [Streptomyces sp. TLI_171]